MELKHFKESEVKGLDPILIGMLDAARDIAGIPFIISSGLRTPEKNTEVGGVENSAHLKGLAADIRCKDSAERFKIVDAAIDAGFKRIGIGKGHIHLDIDTTKPCGVLFIE